MTVPADRLRPRARLLVTAALLVAAAAGCAKPKTDTPSTSSVPAGGPQQVSGPVTAPPSTATPPSTAARNPACAASDAWGFAILKATDPAQRGTLTPEQLAANLTTTADAIKKQVPANAADIDIRTATAKKVLDGAALSDADKQAEKDAATRLDAWYKATCPA